MVRTVILSLLALGACAPKPTPTAASPSPARIVGHTSGEAGFHTTTWFVIEDDGVVVVDAQFTPEEAEAALQTLRQHTDKPVTHVVATHPNPDKFNGAPLFQQEGAAFVVSDATAEALPGVHAYKQAYFEGVGAFPEGAYPDLPSVDRTFSGSLQLSPGVELLELPHAGVSSTQTVVRVDGQHLIVGDLVAVDTHAWLEGGIVDGQPTPDIDGWTAALEHTATLGAGELYPGRGPARAVDQAVSQQVDYLHSVDALVTEYVEALDASDLSGEDAGAHWGALTDAASAAYPDHEHAYLVTYGVYGLSFARLAGE